MYSCVTGVKLMYNESYPGLFCSITVISLWLLTGVAPLSWRQHFDIVEWTCMSVSKISSRVCFSLTRARAAVAHENYQCFSLRINSYRLHGMRDVFYQYIYKYIYIYFFIIFFILSHIFITLSFDFLRYTCSTGNQVFAKAQNTAEKKTPLQKLF